jgi:hypothetical protein
MRFAHKYGFRGFILILVFVPDATKEEVVRLEESVLDNFVCAYNITLMQPVQRGYTL